MRARTLNSPRPSIFDALGEKYGEPPLAEPGEPSRRKGPRFAAAAVVLLVAGAAVAYVVDAARTPPRREVGEISLFQPAASLPPGVVIPKPPRATKAHSVPPLPPVIRPASPVPVREKEAESPPSPPAPAPAPSPVVEAPRPAPVPPPEAPALETEESAAETVPAPEIPQPATEDVQVGAEDVPVSAEVVPVEPAVKVFSPPPAYPQSDWVAAVEGDVSLEATIDAEGRVASVQVLQGVSPGLDAAAVRALRRWRYRPATQGGEAVSSVQRLTFRFRR